MLYLVLLLLAANDPKQAETLLRHGLAQLQQDRLTTARQDFEAASRIDSQNAYVWALLAQTYWRLADKPRALRAAQSAEKLGTGNANVAHMLTIFYSEAGDLKRAASFERAYALSNAADPDALSRAASLSLAAGDIPEALTFAQQALDRNASAANHNLFGRVQIAAEVVESSSHFSSQNPLSTQHSLNCSCRKAIRICVSYSVDRIVAAG